MYSSRAFNYLTRESMNKPEYPRFSNYGHLSEWLKAYHAYLSGMKVYDAFVATCPPFPSYERPKMVHAKEKGIPIPRTGYRRWHSNANKGKSGVIANSRVVSHRYMSEGDKGPDLRREIKRKERVYVAAEIAEGYAEWLYGDESDDYDPYEYVA